MKDETMAKLEMVLMTVITLVFVGYLISRSYNLVEKNGMHWISTEECSNAL